MYLSIILEFLSADHAPRWLLHQLVFPLPRERLLYVHLLLFHLHAVVRFCFLRLSIFSDEAHYFSPARTAFLVAGPCNAADFRRLMIG